MIEYLKKLQQGSVLTEEEAAGSLRLIMNGNASEAQIGAFLMALSLRGETSAEITGAAKVLREKVLTIKAPADAVDCCGTGGDGAGTLNISTGVALVAAACGVPVAKHGNRAASSNCGTADVLEHLGVNIDLPADALEKALKDIGFCFLMAPRHHQAMKYVVPVRRQVGFRTIFNLLGPLANPAGTACQLIGVFDKKWLLPMAEALRELGSRRAWIVHGHDGLDEITLTGPTEITVLEKGNISDATLEPDSFGLPRIKPEDITGNDAAYNARALQEVLEGKDNAYRNMILANTAAVLLVHGSETDLKNAVKRAASAIDVGDAKKLLNRYIDFSRSCNVNS